MLNTPISQQTLSPSRPGWHLSAADILRAKFTPDALGRLTLGIPTQAPGPSGIEINLPAMLAGGNSHNVAQNVQQVIQNIGSDQTQLLALMVQLIASMLQSQTKSNCNYRPAAFGFATYRKQMLFAENPNREYLLIQNAGSNDLYVVFEDGPASLQDFSAAANQAQLIGLQTRSLNIVAGGYYEPLVVPRNPITIFTLNGATNGLGLEGS